MNSLEKKMFDKMRKDGGMLMEMEQIETVAGIRETLALAVNYSSSEGRNGNHDFTLY